MKLIEAIEAVNAAKKKKEEAKAASFSARKGYKQAQIDCKKKATEELGKEPLYKALLKVRDGLETLKIEAEANYREWYRCGPDGDDIDFNIPYPETEETLRPIVGRIEAVESEVHDKITTLVNNKEASVYAEDVAKAFDKMSQANKELDASIEKYKRALEVLKWGCPDLVVNGTVIDNIETWVGSVNKSYYQYDEFDASEGKVILKGHLELEGATLVDEEDYCDDLSKLSELEVEPIADNEADEIARVLEKAYPGYNFDISYKILDRDYWGDKHYQPGYEDEETGYCEPEGYFYMGDVSVSAIVEVEITITKEEK